VDYQRLLLDHLDLIDQIVRTTGRRRHFSAIEQDEFASLVRLRLVEDDYAVLRKFQGRSSLWTYLAAVIERQSLDFCVEQWGRWRPSKMAERLGTVGIILERLVYRDGHPFEEAIEIARRHHGVALNHSELHALWQQLPARNRTIEVGEDAAAAVPSADSSEERLEDAARKQDIERLERALATAFTGLPAQDRVIIALRFDQGLSVAAIAKVLKSSVPTVHRRLDRSLKELRAALRQANVDPRDFSGLIGHSSVALSPLLRSEIEKFPGRVRLSKRDG
jgi:RNA polymerase sigma factor for flagellar operon FliA